MSARNDLIEGLLSIQNALDEAIYSVEEVDLDEDEAAEYTSALDESQWYVAAALKILREEE